MGNYPKPWKIHIFHTLSQISLIYFFLSQFLKLLLRLKFLFSSIDLFLNLQIITYFFSGTNHTLTSSSASSIRLCHHHINKLMFETPWIPVNHGFKKAKLSKHIEPVMVIESDSESKTYSGQEWAKKLNRTESNRTNRTEPSQNRTKLVMVYFGWKNSRTELTKPNRTEIESIK